MERFEGLDAKCLGADAVAPGDQVRQCVGRLPVALLLVREGDLVVALLLGQDGGLVVVGLLVQVTVVHPERPLKR